MVVLCFVFLFVRLSFCGFGYLSLVSRRTLRNESERETMSCCENEYISGFREQNVFSCRESEFQHCESTEMSALSHDRRSTSD